jgi:hypothetical protein
MIDGDAAYLGINALDLLKRTMEPSRVPSKILNGGFGSLAAMTDWTYLPLV